MAATEPTNMNGVAVETAVKTVRRAIRKRKTTTPKATESKCKPASILQDQLVQRKEGKSNHKSSDSPTVCNGIADKTVADVTPNSTPKTVDSLNDVVNIGATAPNLANVVFLCPPTTTGAKNTEPAPNSKLYVLNGNVPKEVNDVDKVNGDKVNYVCVTPNNLGNVIKKIQTENAAKNGKPPISVETDEKLKLLSTKPTFIQLSHPSLKSGSSPKIAFTVSPTIVTKSTTNNCEILRSKLLENATSQPVKTKTAEQSASIALLTAKKESDSPAVAKARSELVRCRKALIEAAIHPQLPTYTPPAYYTGPTYSCEECEDSFASPEGLSKHKNRRSVLFTYACPVCKKTLEFYSRCTFLLHVRSHDVAVKACFLTISIIPATKLNFPVLDGQLHRNEDESAPLFDPATDGRCSPAADKSTCDASAPNHQIVPIYRKRKAQSPVQPGDGSGDRLESSGSSDDVTALEVDDSPPRVDCATIPAPKVKKRSPKPSADKPTMHSAATAVTTVTASPILDNCASLSSGASSPSEPPAGATFDEIHLTSSDEDEPAPPEEPKNHWIPCRECHQEVPSLTSHYRASNRPLREYLCEQCKFFNPSACALAAHSRMHSRSVPFICPDCGFYFSTIDSFLIHVKQVCFYDFKAIRFKCPECSLLKPSVPLFIEHLKRCHIREVFKCSVCITSSHSARIVQTHMERVHPETTPNVLEGYRCMLCPNMLVAKQSIGVHVKKHVYSLQHLRYVYICKFCRKFASGRMSKFEAHYRSCAERQRDSSPSETASKKSQLRKSRKRPPSVEKDPLLMEDWEADRLKADFGPKTKCCVMCRTAKLNEHSKSLFCNACVSYVNADSASPTDAPEGAEKEVGGRSKRKLKCKLCKQLLNRDWGTITNHYLQDHHADFDVGAAKSKAQEGAPPSRKRKSSTPKQEPACASTANCASGASVSDTVASSALVRATVASSAPASATTTSSAAASATSKNSVPASATSKNSAPASATSKNSAPASATTKNGAPASATSKNSAAVRATITSAPVSAVASLVPTKVPKIECKYRCVKCGFSTNVRNDFHEHIVSHKKQSNTNYQCLECGECFIVKPSLEKHLIVVHKVRDIVEYDRENRMVGASSDDDADDQSKQKTVAENQCEVCYMECNSKQQYDRHIRTHGMAFVAMQSRSKS